MMSMAKTRLFLASVVLAMSPVLASAGEPTIGPERDRALDLAVAPVVQAPGAPKLFEVRIGTHRMLLSGEDRVVRAKSPALLFEGGRGAAYLDMEPRCYLNRLEVGGYNRSPCRRPDGSSLNWEQLDTPSIELSIFKSGTDWRMKGRWGTLGSLAGGSGEISEHSPKPLEFDFLIAEPSGRAVLRKDGVVEWTPSSASPATK